MHQAQPDTYVMILAVYALQRKTTIVVIVDDLGQILCDGLLGLHVFIYAMNIYRYIYSINRFAGHGKEILLKLLLENDPFCHAMETLGMNVKPGVDAMNQTMKAIIYVICIMQPNASALT